MNWTAQKCLELRTCLEAGLSYGEAAKKLKTTRSSISGIVSRFGKKIDFEKVTKAKELLNADKMVRKCLKCEKEALQGCFHCGKHLVQKIPVRTLMNPLTKNIV